MKSKFKPFLLHIIVLIFVSCKTDIDNQVITEERKNHEGIRTIIYPDKFKNEESYSIYLKALKCVRKDDYKGSKTYLEQALRIDANNSTIINDLALTEMRLFNYDRATDLFKEAIEIDSSYYRAYCNLGLNYYYDDRFAEGITTLKLVPVDSTGQITRGSLFYHFFMNYTKLGDCDSARHYYNLINDFATNEIFLQNVEDFKENEFKKNCPQ